MRRSRFPSDQALPGNLRRPAAGCPAIFAGSLRSGGNSVGGMGKYDRVRENTGWGVPGLHDTSRTEAEVAELIELSHAPDARVRKIAVINLCPCHVRSNIPAACDR